MVVEYVGEKLGDALVEPVMVGRPVEVGGFEGDRVVGATAVMRVLAGGLMAEGDVGELVVTALVGFRHIGYEYCDVIDGEGQLGELFEEDDGRVDGVGEVFVNQVGLDDGDGVVAGMGRVEGRPGSVLVGVGENAFEEVGLRGEFLGGGDDVSYAIGDAALQCRMVEQSASFLVGAFGDVVDGDVCRDVVGMWLLREGVAGQAVGHVWVSYGHVEQLGGYLGFEVVEGWSHKGERGDTAVCFGMLLDQPRPVVEGVERVGRNWVALAERLGEIERWQVETHG